MQAISASKISATLLISGLALLSATESTAAATVYTRRDVRGVAHFSTIPLPGWKVFHLRTAPEQRATSVVRLAGREGGYRGIIRECAEKYGVDAALVKAMIHAESAFNPGAVSPRGARGLMQLTPRTARKHGVSNVEDPRQNIRGGVGHLRWLLDQFDNDVTLAIAAYNAGAGSVARYGGLPPYPETRTFVAKVLRLRREYLRQEDARLARG
jgi:soluble lytic murein transglycosylase-like protein